MKKRTTLITLVTALLSTQAFAESGWWRDANDHNKAWANSDGSNFQALIKSRALDSDSPYVSFSLVGSNKSFCSNKGDEYNGHTTMKVNDQRIDFSMTCYKNEFLNMVPKTHKGLDYIFKEFNSYRNKQMTFVVTYEDQPDWVFTFPTRNFGQYYSSLKKSLKDTL
ncbi:hypothetical protein AB4589_25180 [Vibrio sp. 10N.222.49.A3]|uniref:hypothetical protein n=1 Tax=Vibrio sp. 10N.222.49.A3 TaxID=3229611 RepID=UPI00354C5671